MMLISFSPATNRSKLYSNIRRTLSGDAVEEELICGVMMTLGAVQRGCSSGSGSGSVTSNAAPEIKPSSRALTSSSVWMIGPLAMFEIKVFLFESIWNSSWPIRCLVLDVKGTEISKISRSELKNSWSSSFVVPEYHFSGIFPSGSPRPSGLGSLRRLSGVFFGCRVYAWTLNPKAWETLATWRPILP